MADLGKVLGLSVSSAIGYYCGYTYGSTPVDVEVGQTIEDREIALADAANINTFKLISGVSSVAYALLGVQNPAAQATIVSLGSYILGETFKSYNVLSRKEKYVTADGIVRIDWQKTFEQRKRQCEAGDQKACKQMEIARSKLPEFANRMRTPAQAGQKTPQVTAPDVNFIAIKNAKKACTDGDNNACCWLKKQKNVQPPKPCRESVAGFGNYLGGF